MLKIEFHDPLLMGKWPLTYSVIAARYRGEWLLVRHSLRETFEIPGGHIESGETADEAAARELKEETGAVDFTITCVSGYSVERDGITGYGMLYFAEVYKTEHISENSEIAEVKTASYLPANLTYPDIQPVLLARVIRYIQQLPS